MIAEALKEDFYSIEEMAKMLRIKQATLKTRISTGTNHPPVAKIGAEYLFSKEEFRTWAKTRPVIYEVRSAS